MKEKITTDKAPKPVGSYPHARRVDRLLFLSGIGPRDAATNDIPGNEYDSNGALIKYDIEAQCHTVFKNIRNVLEESGSSWDQLIDVVVFLTNMKDDFTIYNRIYAEYFQENQPCRTTVEVKSLPTPIAIELKCIAGIID